MEKILDEHGHEVAAVVVEPLLQAPGGMLRLPDGWLRRVRELCDRAGTLLVVDEVATGFGRTGKMFACEHEGVSPDLMGVAKGMTAGFLPLAATLANERVFDGFLGPVSDGRQMFHGHSYTGNALGCAAALANLDVFEQENVLARVNALAERLRGRLAGLAELSAVGDIRQLGLIAGVELVRDKGTRQAFDPADRIGHHVCMAMRRDGVILRPLGDTVVLMPPLSVSEEQLDHIVTSLARAIESVTGA
jgi:adenosylmethionine-8-amino-7-oxononanoate aminotransferase